MIIKFIYVQIFLNYFFNFTIKRNIRKYKYLEQFRLMITYYLYFIYTFLLGWAIAARERNWKYRLSIYYAKHHDSGVYTCSTPKGLSNSIQVRVIGTVTKLHRLKKKYVGKNFLLIYMLLRTCGNNKVFYLIISILSICRYSVFSIGCP